jgi:DNA-binding transcriptional LysR family regulator
VVAIRTGPGSSALEPLPSAPLAAFVAAHETGSIQGAADALSLTQSAVTKRIQTLERLLGAPVFERGRFGVRPTPLGQTIYPLAKQALMQLREVADAADAAGRREQRELRLSASHTIGEFLLPGWLSSYRRFAPDVRPQLEIVNSKGVLDAVRARRSAVGFVEGHDPLEGLDSIVLARDALVVVVTAEHRWATRRSVAAQELTSEPYLTREQSSGTRGVATAALLAVGIELTPAFEAASTQSLKRALTGDGFTIVSSLVIGEEQRAGTHVALPVRGVDLSRELRAVRRRRPAAREPARGFWRWLAATPTD